MSGVRVLVGTRKGAFILGSDGRRERWTVDGPLFGGWEIYHVKGSAVDSNRLYASQSSGWFGQIINGRTMAAGPGRRSETGSRTTACPGRISGTTVRRIRGNSSASGISSRP